MTISRQNIPEQMFATGGVATMDDSLAELAALIERKKDFDTNRAKYEQRLGSVVEPTQPMDVFDAASAIGKGLLETPNTGGSSAYIGLAAGFNNLSDEVKENEERMRQERQQVAMKAMELAMTDEREAEKYLSDYNFELIKNANKKVEYQTIEYTNEKGDQVSERVKDNTEGNTYINDLMAKGMKVRIIGDYDVVDQRGESELSKKTAASITDDFKQRKEKLRAATATQEQVGQAFQLAQKIGPSGFGPTQRMLLPFREFAVEMGVGGMDKFKIGDQKALNQLSMNFTMGIVSMTKGAISDREMKLFIGASPTLGSTYDGFMSQLKLLDRLSIHDVKRQTDYLNEAARLDEQGLTSLQIQGKLATFDAEWRKKNPFLTKEEEEFLQNAIDNPNYAEGFVPQSFEAMTQGYIDQYLKGNELSESEKLKIKAEKNILKFMTSEQEILDAMEEGPEKEARQKKYEEDLKRLRQKSGFE